MGHLNDVSAAEFFKNRPATKKDPFYEVERRLIDACNLSVSSRFFSKFGQFLCSAASLFQQGTQLTKKTKKNQNGCQIRTKTNQF